MRLLHYVEIENFKRFGERQRIELEHPAVLIGPNNCGKTTAIQALALWSQAVRTWYDATSESGGGDRMFTLNRLNVVSVPVQRTRYFWHNANVQDTLSITVGVFIGSEVKRLGMRFRHDLTDELVYVSPALEPWEDLDLIEHAAKIRVELLYPMSGLETEEPILQPGRIDVLLGLGQTAQVLRNLCLIVERTAPADWAEIQRLMKRLFAVELGKPSETARGGIDLRYSEPGIKEALDVSLAGRGFQQMLLIFAYLYSHKGSVLLIDEPDAHLEILRQKQVYVLLREIAARNGSQVVMVTHSEVILEEALDNHLTLILDGRADDLARKASIKDTLKHFGAEHYVRARDRGYVLYVEGSTDVDMLRALADKLNHPVLGVWDERVNSYYLQNNFPVQDTDAELERVEGGYGLTAEQHFDALRDVVSGLRGLSIQDNDGKGRQPRDRGTLRVRYWKRYETENYFVTPDALRAYAVDRADGTETQIENALSEMILESVFDGDALGLATYQTSSADAAKLIWEAKTERLKLSDFAEEFFRRLAAATGGQMLLRKGELHRLVPYAESIPAEVSEKLDELRILFEG